MSSSNPRGWLDGVLGFCFSLLLAAVALYIAVGLIKAIWPILLALLIVGGLVAAGVALLRSRNRGW
jgi:uncharacterized membrane protein